MLSLFEILSASGIVTIIRTTPLFYAIVNAVHILGLGAMIGAILTLDLRVIGLWRPQGWRESVAVSSPIAGAGLALALLTGVLLFAVRPGHYLENGPFLIMLGLLACGLLNVALFHCLLRAQKSAWPGMALRVSAFASVLIWCATLLAGRFIAFLS
ncbi:hypothetical protein A8A54_19295 [Brucella pseudogrignonensis]|uniref:DUF6644 family protein n=1 Tax=Brucella pseudogrignonensis TaxID=419475 RepID=UPI0007DA6E56|nr:DUF6644 family protein [Brucella pseudogrignonensis]ANG98749.1 hypothetical protein A8A54_19295 [Brucella pseudogrignonensis]